MMLQYNGPFISRGSDAAAGWDLEISEDMSIVPGETKLAPTGVRMTIPDGHVGLLFARSSTAVKRGLNLANGVGVIDSDYRGEIKVPLHNFSDSAVWLNKGDRIAQIVVLYCPPMQLTQVAELPETVRGEGGFGSTGL